MALAIRTRLWELACAVALELNQVEDDDERELLQEQFEQHLNTELFAGARNRGMIEATLDAAKRARELRGDSLLLAQTGALRLVKKDAR